MLYGFSFGAEAVFAIVEAQPLTEVIELRRVLGQSQHLGELRREPEIDDQRGKEFRVLLTR